MANQLQMKALIYEKFGAVLQMLYFVYFTVTTAIGAQVVYCLKSRNYKTPLS